MTALPMPSSDFPPPQSTTSSPDLWRMDEYDFQRFCREVWERRGPRVHGYGTRGQGQRGIDLLAIASTPEEQGGGQCKRQKKYTVGDLRAAVKEFLRHRAWWQRRHLTQFKLFVACRCDSTKLVEEVLKVTNRFLKLGIKFEMLDSDRLLSEAKRYPEIIAQYLGLNWVQVLCGDTTAGSGAGFGAGEPLLHAVTGVFTEWSAFKNQELDAIREEFRCGRTVVAHNQLLAFRQSPLWKELSEEVQARALRLLVSITLDLGGDLAEARRLVEEARQLHTSQRVQILDALLAYHEGTAADGLTALGQPQTVDAWNVQLALWLANGEMRRVTDAVATPSFPPNAETHRLHAMALLFNQQVEEAEAVIAESLAAQPEWSAMRQSQAIIDYVATISPHFHAWMHLTWPVPSERTLVKSDDASRAKLARSAAAFERLLMEVPPDASRRVDLETWRLAALANNPETVPEAERWAAELLNTNAAHFRVVIWALERGFQIDRPRVRAALGELVKSPEVDLDAIIALVHLTSMDGDLAGARALLETKRNRFFGGRLESVWRFLMVQVFVQLGDDSSADALVAEETDDDFARKERAIMAMIRAQRSPEAPASPDPFIENYEATGAPEDLLSAVEACVYTRPAWVVEHTDALLTAFPTAGAVRLALAAAWRAEKFQQCFDILAEYQDRFSGGKLPADLRRLEVQCLWNSGKRVEALRRQEALVADTDDAEELSRLLHQQIAFADREGCLRTARALMSVEEPPAWLLLHAAALLAATNRDAAIELWTAATERELKKDEVVMLALDVAFRLGLEERTHGLMREMHAIIRRGSKVVKAPSMEDIIAYLRQRREAVEELNRHYDVASAPIHMLSVMSGISLAEIYHVIPSGTETAKSLLNHTPLFVRYGGRQSDQQIEIPPGHLLMDVTGLLCAAHFDLLDLVEQQFGPLLISASLLECLHAQLRQVEPNQPGLDDARRSVLRMIKEGCITVLPERWPPLKRADDVGRRMGADWCAALDHVMEKEGWLVEDIPLIRFDDEPGPVVLPAAENSRVISRGEMLAALRRAEQLNEEDCRQTTETFGDQPDFLGREITLQRNQLVFLTDSHAEWLARTPALNRLCAFAQVQIDTSYQKQLQQEVLQADARRELADWLRTLIERVSTGLRTGRYVEVQVHVPHDEAAEDLERPEIRCLYDLLWEGNQTNNVVWCDDRFLSTKQNAPGGPLVDIWEVVNAIHRAGRLTDEEYYGRLIRLRRANVRYLPLSSKEILYHLRNATVLDGIVQESSELVVLRQSVAAALLDAKRFMLPSPQHLAQHDLAELRWATGLAGELISAIAHLWKAQDLDRARARTDWIWDNLYWELGAIRDLHPQFLTQHEDGTLFASEVGRFFSVGSLLPSDLPPPGDNIPDSPRRAFFRWLWERKVQPTLTTNPELRASVAKELTEHAEGMVSQLQQHGIPERTAAVHVHRILTDLANEFQQEIQPPPSLVRVLGIAANRHVIQAGGHEFLPENFWHAMTKAINGGAETVTSTLGDDFTFRAGEARDFGFAVRMMRVGTDQEQEVSGTFLPLLQADEPRRRTFLETNQTLLDMPTKDREKAISEILAQKNGVERIQLAELYASRSGETFYQLLQVRLRAGEQLHADDFMPEVASAIALHLRLAASVPANIALTGERLLQEVGLEEAAFRLSGLPALLPDCIIAAAVALDAKGFAEMFARLRQRCLSPTSRMALFHLVAQRVVHDPVQESLAIQVRDELLDPSNGLDVFKGFMRLLRWTFERLRLCPETPHWPPSVLLAVAWSHASRIHNLLLRFRVENEVVEGSFTMASALLPRFVRPERAEIMDDSAAYLHTQWNVLLVRGLGAALAILPDKLATRFRIERSPLLQALSKDENDQVALVELAAETETRPNSLSSYLGGPWEEPIRALLGDALFAESFDSTAEQLALSHLEALENDPLAVDAWVVLCGVIGDAPYPSAGRDRLKDLINTVEFAQLVRREPEKASLALHFACAQARLFPNTQTRSRMEGQLLACTQICREIHEQQKGELSEIESYMNVLSRIVEAAYRLHMDEGAATGETGFANLAVQLMRICPDLGSSLRERLGKRPSALPMKFASGLWPLYLAIRATP